VPVGQTHPSWRHVAVSTATSLQKTVRTLRAIAIQRLKFHGSSSNDAEPIGTTWHICSSVTGQWQQTQPRHLAGIRPDITQALATRCAGQRAENNRADATGFTFDNA
jgi:hypothetical protein